MEKNKKMIITKKKLFSEAANCTFLRYCGRNKTIMALQFCVKPPKENPSYHGNVEEKEIEHNSQN